MTTDSPKDELRAGYYWEKIRAKFTERDYIDICIGINNQYEEEAQKRERKAKLEIITELRMITPRRAILYKDALDTLKAGIEKGEQE